LVPVQVEVNLTCMSCKHSRSRVELFTNLSLPVEEASEFATPSPLGSTPYSPPIELKELLVWYFRERTLEYKCEKCGHNELSAAPKIFGLPNVLVRCRCA
jgi:uncharacterized UBP type Zn finger protein